MERIIHAQICTYLSSNNLLSPSQHSFISGRSLTPNLLQCVNDWLFSLDSCHNIDVLYIDLSKVFNSVIHFILLTELSIIGFTYNLF